MHTRLAAATLLSWLLIATPVFAYTFTAQNATGVCGVADVIASVNVDDATGMQSFQFDLVYDPTRIEVVVVTRPALILSWSLSSNKPAAGVLSVAAAGATPLGAGSGPIAEVHFRVLATAAHGTTSPLDLRSTFANETTATAVDGVFTVSCRRGDANGDGTLSSADVVYLLRTLFGGGPQPFGSGDVNGDGQFTIADVFYLINHLFSGGPAPPA